ncbi:glycosyltransferase 87 family protein [Luteococcus sp. Sow4_B9]|uniref:glycosyltransferase 87 family protein n=1 Tax=Luteococcus sp. Sow4_B9 TaxID=3438792 RepID=UPI003F975663
MPRPVVQRGVGLLSAVLAVLATVHYCLTPWRGRADEMAAYPYANSMMTDFRDTVILPAQAIARGMNPYDIESYVKVFTYSQEFNPYMPWWLGLTGPLEPLGWERATLVYSVALGVGTSLLAAVAGVLVARRLRESMPTATPLSPWVVAAAMVVWVWIWRPTSIGQGLGNVGAFAALAALLALLTRQWGWASLWLAIAWVKPQFGIPLVIILLVRKRWRQAVAGTLLAAVLSLPMVVRLSEIAGGFPELVASVIRATTWVGVREGGEPFMGRVDLAGLLEAVGLGIGSMVPMLLGAVLVGVAAFLSSRYEVIDRPALAILLVSCALMVGFPHLHYDLPMLAPLVPWCLWEAWQARGRGIVRDPGLWLTVLLVPVGLASDHLLPEQFPVSRLGGVVVLVCIAVLVRGAFSRHVPALGVPRAIRARRSAAES